MSLVPPFKHENCPPAYGGCSCSCHRNSYVRHIIPCCYPSQDEALDELVKQAEEDGLYYGPVTNGKPIC